MYYEVLITRERADLDVPAVCFRMPELDPYRPKNVSDITGGSVHYRPAPRSEGSHTSAYRVSSKNHIISGNSALHVFFCNFSGNNCAGALVQWLKLPAWEVRDRGFEPHSGLQVSKTQNVSSPLTRKYCEEPP